MIINLLLYDHLNLRSSSLSCPTCRELLYDVGVNDVFIMKQLAHLEAEINIFAQEFEKKYFDELSDDSYWVADVVGGTYYINDHFFTLDDMMEFIRHAYNEEDMFNYYQYALETYEDKSVVTVCIRDWRKLESC